MGLIFGKEKTKPVKKQEERVDENDDDGRSRILKGDFSKIPENPANEIGIFLSSTFSGIKQSILKGNLHSTPNFNPNDLVSIKSSDKQNENFSTSVLAIYGFSNFVVLK